MYSAKMLAKEHERPGCCTFDDPYYAPKMHVLRRRIQRRREDRSWRKEYGV